MLIYLYHQQRLDQFAISITVFFFIIIIIMDSEILDQSTILEKMLIPKSPNPREVGVTSTHNKRGCAILTKKVAPKNPEVI